MGRQRLTLVLQDNCLEWNSFRVEWPPGGGRGICASLLGHSAELVESINTTFIMANLPEDDRVYFAVGSQLLYENENMKEKLASYGESFEERSGNLEAGIVGVFRRRRVQEKAGIIFGSTTRREVLEAVFGSYISWSTFSWPFFFAIAKEEPRDWKDLVSPFTAWDREEKKISIDLLCNCHCIMVTHLDHGMLIASNKIPSSRIFEISKEIAEKYSLPLTVKVHQQFNRLM